MTLATVAVDSLQVTGDTLYLMGAVAAGTATIVMFMLKGFSDNRRLFYQVMSLHNKEDDDRFQALSDEIWELHLYNARRDGGSIPSRRTMPRRRYLAEATDSEFGGSVQTE